LTTSFTSLADESKIVSKSRLDLAEKNKFLLRDCQGEEEDGTSRLSPAPLKGIQPLWLDFAGRKELDMGRKRFSPEQIITMLREAEVLLGQGAQVADVWRKLGISEQTYYRWGQEYGGMRIDQAKRLKELE